MTAAYRFVVTGRVQGVGFRQTAAGRASALGLAGWIRNRDDGAVEGIVTSADAGALAEFHRWLAEGPPAARVDAMIWEVGEPLAAEGFTIRR